MTTLTDAELVERAAAGDRAAYTDLYRRHIDTVHDHVARWSRDSALAADATQEAFVALLTHLDAVRDGQAVLAWLLRTARNRAIDQIRRASRETATTTTPDGAIPSALLSTPATGRDDDPVAVSERSEATELVWEVAAGLDERTFSVLDLSVRQGLTGPELADVLETTPGNANVLVHRMRERMRSLFGAVLLLRTPEDASCAALTSLRAAAPDPVDAAAARELHAHADGCDSCGERRRHAVAPLQAYAAFAAVAAPTSVLDALEAAAAAHFGAAVPAATAATAATTTTVLPATLGAAGAGGGADADGRPERSARDEHRRNVVIAAVVALVAAVGLGALLWPDGDAPSATGEPIAGATASPSPEDSPSPTPSASPADDGATPADGDPTATPSPSPEPSPSPSPSPEVLAPLAVTIDEPADGATTVADGEDEQQREVGPVPVRAVVTGGSGEHLVRWTTSEDSDGSLLDAAEGVVQVWLTDPCQDTPHTLTVTVTDTTTEEVVTASVGVLVLHTCPPPLDVRISAPTDGQTTTVSTVDGSGRAAGEVQAAASAGGSGLEWTWTSDQQPGETLLRSAEGTLQLANDSCEPVIHVITVEVFRPSDGASGTASVEVTVEPICVT